MPIQDSSPERRNLLILSLSIIVFYLAEGSFTGQSIRLQVVNIVFSKPEVLKYIIWILLLWFIYRYWLVMKGSWERTFYSELSANGIISFFYNHHVKKFDLTNDYSDSIYKDKHWITLHTEQNRLTFQYISQDKSNRQKSKYKEMSTNIDKIVFLTYIMREFFLRPTLSTYVIPYFLATYAIALILCNSFC